MKKRDWINLAILILVIVISWQLYRNRTRSTPHRAQHFLLGTLVSVDFTGTEEPDSVMARTFALIRDLEARYDYSRQDSEVSQINHSAGQKVAIDDGCAEMLQLSQRIHSQTDSLYDPTVGRLLEVWGFTGESLNDPDPDSWTMPDSSAIAAALQYTGFDRIELTVDSLTMPDGFRLHLGSVAKGFIIDRAVEFLQEQGAIRGFINAGGDLRFFGYNTSIAVGVRHPRDPNSLIDTLYLMNKAVVTSGDYERYHIVGGRRYHHILNPVTGYPPEGTVSVTVIADNATLADALSTAMFLLSPDEAVALADKYPGVDVMVIHEDADEGVRRVMSSGMKKYKREGL